MLEALKYLTKDFEEFKDDMKDQMNDLKVDRIGTKKGIYAEMDKRTNNLRKEIETVAKNLQTFKDDIEKAKWKIVMWLFIIIGGQTVVERILNSLLGG